MGITLDIVLALVCVIFVAVGAHRGLIRSAAHFLGAVIAACLAALLGGAVAQWVFDALFRPALVERVGESLANLGNGDTYTAVQSVFSTLPEFLLRALDQAGVNAASVTEAMAGQSGQAAELIADALSPVFVSFLKVLAVIVLFCLFMVLVRIASNALSVAFHLPLLNGLNGLLGSGIHLDCPGSGGGVHPHAGCGRASAGGECSASVVRGWAHRQLESFGHHVPVNL